MWSGIHRDAKRGLRVSDAFIEAHQALIWALSGQHKALSRTLRETVIYLIDGRVDKVGKVHFCGDHAPFEQIFECATRE